MALTLYREKRNFRQTPEPRGAKRASKSSGWSFVVQKHAASRLHYDFRLELNGVLLSWAIPKGPSLDPADKRLAMHVEDHPLEYGGFEGTIPKGEYGGGTVMVWDRGTWTPQGDPVKGYREGHLKFTLDGDKLHGGWALVRMRGGKDGDKAWLLIKEKDEFARAGRRSIVDRAPNSAISGRDLDAIAEDRSPRSRWTSKDRKRGSDAAAGVRRRSVDAGAEPVDVARGKKAPMPETLAPALATLVKDPPQGDDWIHEVKFDGYRMLGRIEHGRCRLLSRNGRDWTKNFPVVARDLAALPVESAWIDGEVAIVGANGRTSFQALQNALSASASSAPLFFAFDLLYRDGADLRALPLTERKQALQELVAKGTGVIRVGPEGRGGGEDFFRQACKLGLEGIVSKRADSRYSSGVRTRDWVKVKCGLRQEMVIGGYTEPQGSRQGFGALLLGHYEGDALRYAGRVGTGFDDRTLRELYPRLKQRERATSPFADPPRGAAIRNVHWVRPDLVAEVAFTEWSADGALRHPSFQGLRSDKKAEDVVRETPSPAAQDAPEDKPRAKARTSGRAATRRASRKPPSTTDQGDAVAGVALSNPDKLYFPEDRLTKRDVAAYYAAVAPRLLPHIAGRPLSLVRCPEGWAGQCFYQKHANRAVHQAVERMDVPEGKSTATYLAADSAQAVVGLVQWGVIEIHPWGARAPRLDRPDLLIFDFDPDDALAWKELVAAVGLLRTLLDEMKLTGFLKTTGGKGLHVVLPIRPTLSWDEAKSFAKAVADFLVRTFPDRFTANMAKAERAGKIFIDYLRNAQGATAIAPYGVRARAHAPVATPIDWSELARDVRFHHFNIRNVPQRVDGSNADPWAAFGKTRQTITQAMRKRLA